MELWLFVGGGREGQERTLAEASGHRSSSSLLRSLTISLACALADSLLLRLGVIQEAAHEVALTWLHIFVVCGVARGRGCPAWLPHHVSLTACLALAIPSGVCGGACYFFCHMQDNFQRGQKLAVRCAATDLAKASTNHERPFRNFAALQNKRIKAIKMLPGLEV